MKSKGKTRTQVRNSKNGGGFLIFILLLAIAAIAGLAIFLRPTSLVANCQSPEIDKSLTQQSSNIQAQVYVDGTPSMNGFVNGFANAGGSRYIRTLRTFNTAIAAKWEKSQIKFYRFGDNRREELRLTDFQQAQTADFYPTRESPSETYPFFENSQLTDVINAEKPTLDNLTLIFSDLTENKQNMLSIFAALKQKYLNAGYAVGILALRSEFNGTVYDVGLNNQSFYWNTNSPDRKGVKFHRPFYLLMLGRYANVNYLYERLTASEPELVKDGKLVIFDRRVANSALTLDLKQSPAKETDGIVSSINYDGAWVESDDKSKDKVQLLRINSDKPSKYTYKFEKSPVLPNTIATFDRGVKYENTVKRFDPSTKKFVNNDEARDTVGLREVSFSDRQTEYEVTFKPKVGTNGVYEIKTEALLGNLPYLSWLPDWTVDERNATDGSRTFNVGQLFKDLQDLVITANSDRTNDNDLLARFCFVAEIR